MISEELRSFIANVDVDLFVKALDYIEENPDKHDQALWGSATFCGTSHCVAGWILELSGKVHKWEWSPVDYHYDGVATLNSVRLSGRGSWWMGPGHAANALIGFNGWNTPEILHSWWEDQGGDPLPARAWGASTTRKELRDLADALTKLRAEAGDQT